MPLRPALLLLVPFFGLALRGDLGAQRASTDSPSTWWSWQPSTDPAVPPGADDSAIDRFVMARLHAAGLHRAPRAAPRELIRRLHFALTGLPPSPDEIDAFVADHDPDAYAGLVDRLLDSPRFGERFARHWMDWIRYADSHGSEGDPAIPHAWRYRDYLIRALNQDVGYGQLVREHVAGDLLAEPRIDEELELVESRIGAAQYRFVQHGFAPTDALEEKVRVVDNQIDVLSKTFLGLTVSCARCHDHKFDAISQADYYALVGVLGSMRPALVEADTEARLARHDAELARLKGEIRAGLAEAWTRSLHSLFRRIDPGFLDRAAEAPLHPLHALAVATGKPPEEFAATWAALVAEWRASQRRLAEARLHPSRREARAGTLGNPDRWLAHGTGLRRVATDGPSAPGALHLLPDGDRIVDDLLPAGCYSHLRSSKDAASLTSPTLAFDATRSLYVRVMGDGDARARYVVHGYPRRGTVYPVHSLSGGKEHWVRWDPTYWDGDRGYLEFTTAADQPVEADLRAARSWFGVTAVAQIDPTDSRAPRDEMAEVATPLFEVALAQPPQDASDLLVHWTVALSRCLQAWEDGTLRDDQARFLAPFVRANLLPTRLDELPELADAITAWRALENELPVARRIPGQHDAEPRDWPLFVRGNHRDPAAPVPRRFLESLDPTPYDPDVPARLQLAEDLVAPDNPFTARVAVNRIWAVLFGKGLVTTVDNFGRLGTEPTHPELLDWLATRFVEDGWSIKTLIRRIVRSETWQAASTAPADAARLDPDNRLLAHRDVRRLDAEALRDALLAVSGQLELAHEGSPVAGGSNARSVYVRIQRNDLDPFLHAFDAPAPHTTHGMRDATNVPAQALTLLNDPFVHRAAERLADRVFTEVSAEKPRARVTALFRHALGREPAADEMERCLRFLAAAERDAAELQRRSDDLAEETARTQQSLDALLARVDARVLEARGEHAQDTAALPAPIAAWSFDHDARDAVGTLHGQLRGNARIEDGALLLDGSSYLETRALDRPLAQKTLEAWVQLDDLEQRAGGVMSVQSRDGNRFDAIVFAEQDPQRWLAGSEFFRRTTAFDGPAETEADRRPVHLALRYAADGTITAFRDGVPYGNAYRTDAPLHLTAGDAVVLLGLRHTPAGGNKFLRGRIHEARLYDRALTEDEILASARGAAFVSAADRDAAMDETERREAAQLRALLDELAERRTALGLAAGARPDPRAPWTDLAHTLLNLEEFLFLR